MKKLTICLAAAVMGLSACSSSSDDGDSDKKEEFTSLPPLEKKSSYKVGFVQVYEENNNWRSTNTESILSEGEKRGHTMVFDPTGKISDAAGEAQRMQDVIDAEVDVIILAPQDPTVLAPKVVAARKAGIPVFIEDRSIDEDIAQPGVDFVTYVGSDFYTEGKMVGDWLVDNMDGDLKIIELEGTVGSAPAVDRKDGFDDVIDKNSDRMEIVVSESGDFSREKGKEMIGPLLEENPDVNVIFTHNDAMALGVIEYLEDEGMDPGDLTIVSIDGLKEAVGKIQDGWIAAIAECNPRFGPVAFDTIEDYADGKEMPKKAFNTDRLFDYTTDANKKATDDYYENEAF